MKPLKQLAWTCTCDQVIPNKGKNKTIGTEETTVSIQEAKKDERRYS